MVESYQLNGLYHVAEAKAKETHSKLCYNVDNCLVKYTPFIQKGGLVDLKVVGKEGEKSIRTSITSKTRDGNVSNGNG